jgi:chromosome segregation ATPase
MAQQDSQNTNFLKDEIHNLQDENNSLYTQIKRMEKNWDALLKEVDRVEGCKSKLEKEICKVKHEVKAKTLMITKTNEENTNLKTTLSTLENNNKELGDQLQKHLEEVKSLCSEAQSATEKYKQGVKGWKDEKKMLLKQKEDGVKRWEACEEELQVYVSENGKLEKQLKQV